MTRPLITFAVFGYNQERFIREAIEGAFAQTYEPLEIILSDDCSTDRTFEIMQEMASKYAGPHRLILNRNDPNLRFASHINRVMELATGDLFVLAAGDDVSLPARTEELYQGWDSAGRPSTCVYSDMDQIDKDGGLVRKAPCHGDFSNLTLDEFVDRPIALICTYAFRKDLASQFPPLHADVVSEDFVFPFRALLRGNRLVYVNKPLVRYRIGVGVTANSGVSSRRDWPRLIKRERALLEQLRSDLLTRPMNSARSVAKLNRHLELNDWKMAIVQKSTIRSICELMRRIIAMPTRASESLRTFLVIRYPALTDQLRRLRYLGKS